MTTDQIIFYFWLIPTLISIFFLLINTNGWVIDDGEYTLKSYLMMLIPVLNILVIVAALGFVINNVYKFFYYKFSKRNKYGEIKLSKKEKIAKELDKFKIKDIEKYLREKKLKKISK